MPREYTQKHDDLGTIQGKVSQEGLGEGLAEGMGKGLAEGLAE